MQGCGRILHQRISSQEILDTIRNQIAIIIVRRTTREQEPRREIIIVLSQRSFRWIDLQKIESAAEKNDGGSLPASVVYDEFGLLEEQAKHLMWLNSLSNLKGAQFLPLSRHLKWLETDDIQ